MNKRRGMAIATALILMLVLSVMCVALNDLISSDYRVAWLQQSHAQAFYLAKAGMEYYANRGIPENPLCIPANDKTHFCWITQDPVTSDLYFQGTITDGSSHIIAKRTLIAPGGNLNRWYEK